MWSFLRLIKLIAVFSCANFFFLTPKCQLQPNFHWNILSLIYCLDWCTLLFLSDLVYSPTPPHFCLLCLTHAGSLRCTMSLNGILYLLDIHVVYSCNMVGLGYINSFPVSINLCTLCFFLTSVEPSTDLCWYQVPASCDRFTSVKSSLNLLIYRACLHTKLRFILSCSRLP